MLLAASNPTKMISTKKNGTEVRRAKGLSHSLATRATYGVKPVGSDNQLWRGAGTLAVNSIGS